MSSCGWWWWTTSGHGLAWGSNLVEGGACLSDAASPFGFLMGGVMPIWRLCALDPAEAARGRRHAHIGDGDLPFVL